MRIKDQVISFAKTYSLKEKAMASVDGVLDTCIKSDKDIGIDFLCGNDKSELIYEFERFEFNIDKNNNCLISTRINIYSKRYYGSNIDVPVGYYLELTDMEGQHVDEFLIFDWSHINFDIEYHIERINGTIPKIYFRRNKSEYEFATYVNHIFSLVQSKQFEIAIVFVRRCLDYLDNTKNKEIDVIYLNACQELFNRLYHYIINNDLVDSEKLSRYRLKERIKTKR